MTHSTFLGLAATAVFLFACWVASLGPDWPDRYPSALFYLVAACYFMLRKIDARPPEARP